ncbi:MAG: hypothetical protein U1E05_21595 [Patescibacteria group bacterium]|nr:hypothetical protein [Patescibacteria group bacterium]
MKSTWDLLTDLFEPAAPTGKPPADCPKPVGPAPIEPGGRLATATPDAPGPEPVPDVKPIDFGPDGWPVGSIEPQDCPTCPGLLTWQDVGGRWRCERCDAKALARSQRLVDGAARSRQRWPVKRSTTARGAVPKAATP